MYFDLLWPSHVSLLPAGPNRKAGQPAGNAKPDRRLILPLVLKELLGPLQLIAMSCSIWTIDDRQSESDLASGRQPRDAGDASSDPPVTGDLSVG